MADDLVIRITIRRRFDTSPEFLVLRSWFKIELNLLSWQRVLKPKPAVLFRVDPTRELKSLWSVDATIPVSFHFLTKNFN